jgi:hypothetical protein
MTGHHRYGRHGCCSHCTRCCSGVDEDLWALGELLVAPFVALGTLARWAARNAAGAAVLLTVVASAAIVALAVTS